MFHEKTTSIWVTAHTKYHSVLRPALLTLLPSRRSGVAGGPLKEDASGRLLCTWTMCFWHSFCFPENMFNVFFLAVFAFFFKKIFFNLFIRLYPFSWVNFVNRYKSENLYLPSELADTLFGYKILGWNHSSSELRRHRFKISEHLVLYWSVTSQMPAASPPSHSPNACSDRTSDTLKIHGAVFGWRYFPSTTGHT